MSASRSLSVPVYLPRWASGRMRRKVPRAWSRISSRWAMKRTQRYPMLSKALSSGVGLRGDHQRGRSCTRSALNLAPPSGLRSNRCDPALASCFAGSQTTRPACARPTSGWGITTHTRKRPPAPDTERTANGRSRAGIWGGSGGGAIEGLAWEHWAGRRMVGIAALSTWQAAGRAGNRCVSWR